MYSIRFHNIIVIHALLYMCLCNLCIQWDWIVQVSFDFHRFISNMLKLLVCQNEKFGAQIQKHVKELVGHELNPALYPILFDQIKVCVDKFFDPSGQVMKLDLWKIHDLGHVIADISWLYCSCTCTYISMKILIH